MPDNKLITYKSEEDKIIFEAIYNLMPWSSINFKENSLKTQTENNPQPYLNSYYLFPLDEFTVNSDCDDIENFINKRFQSLLSAANFSGISIILLIHSEKGRNKIYIGFQKDNSNYELFEPILNGLIPGKKIKLDKANITSLTQDFKYGGLITGVPTLKNDDEKQKFNLSSTIRALYGKDYTLAIISKPIDDFKKASSFAEIIKVRDELHKIAKKTTSTEKGESTSNSNNKIDTTGNSETKGHNLGTSGGVVGAAAGAAIGSVVPVVGTAAGALIGFMIGNTINYSRNLSNSETKSYSKGSTYTTSQSESQSLSIEQQNGFAIELEKIADQYIDRIIKGLNSGLWETTITFSAKEEISCEILAGSFIGELSKPNNNLLPPPRHYLDSLNENQNLFLPRANSNNPIFPNLLASYITSEELSLIASPPTESVSGYEVKKIPSLAINDVNEGEFILGNIADHSNPIENSYLTLGKKDLNKHLFICGLTGSGKTTTLKHILKDITKDSIPFLILESAKRDYRQLLADDAFRGKLNIFTIGDATVSPIRFNPFYIQNGVHPLVHIDYLKAIFTASFSLYGPMPHIVEKCLHQIYLKRGWNLTTGTHPHFLNELGEIDDDCYLSREHYYCFPTLNDLKNEVDNYVKNEIGYQGELRDNIRTAIIARLDSLCVGAKGLMFNTYDFYSIEKLLGKSTIFEMENLADDDDKAFFLGLILVLISEYRQKYNPAINPGQKNIGLQHFLVIEEAHRLLKNVSTERTSEMMGNPKGKAVEVFCNVISEMRSLGQGVAVVEQIPSKISPDVIKNSNTKIVHRLVSKDDQALLAGSLSISDNDALYLNRLKTGFALCHKEGMEKPVECSILNDVKSFAISDERVKQLNSANNFLHHYESYEISNIFANKGKALIIQFVNSLFVIDFMDLSNLISKAQEEFNKLLVLNNIRIKYDIKITNDFFVKGILELLIKGIYCRTYKYPKDLKAKLINLLNEPNENNFKVLKQSFEGLWETNNTKDFIEEVIRELSINIYKKNKMKISNIISSYYLLIDNNSISRIESSIINILGVIND